MTIVIGAAQKDYSIVMADTQASSGQEKLYYPSKLMVRPTEQGTEVLGFSGIVPFWDFFKEKDTNRGTSNDVRTHYLSVAEYLEIRREFRKTSTIGSISSRSRYTRASSIISVRANDAYPLREFTSKGLKVGTAYVATGNGSNIAFDTLGHIAPVSDWSKLSRSESMLALLHAYHNSVESVIGCGGVPSIYLIFGHQFMSINYSSTILMQRIERGFTNGLLAPKVAKSGIEHLLDGEDYRNVRELVLGQLRGPKIERGKALLDGFLPMPN